MFSQLEISSDSIRSAIKNSPKDNQSSPFNINLERVKLIAASLFPLTLPYFDRQGFQLQLWKYKTRLIASVMTAEGELKILSGDKIHNALSPDEPASNLLARLEKVGKRRWQLAYFPKTHQLFLWPQLVAAGTEDASEDPIDPAKTYSGKSSIPILDKEIHQAGPHLQKHGRDMGYASKKEYSSAAIAFAKKYQNHPKAEILEGELNIRGKSQPRPIQRVISYGGKSAVIDVETGHVRNFYKDDGSGHKALVEHKIVRKGDGTFSQASLRTSKEPISQQQSSMKGQYPPGKNLIDLAKRAALVARERFKRDDPPSGPGNGGNTPKGPSNGPNDRIKQFQRLFKFPHGKFHTQFFKETLKQNGLIPSYNSSNPGKPIKDFGGSEGSIGGIGMDTGFIEGLFNTFDELESTHHFFIPSTDSSLPFSNRELKQILRELAIGIYMHDTVPFFSLHFNADSNLYPVIHPAYQNTLVGQVISLLDYCMKGFLNGAYFDEAYIKEWQSKPTHDIEELKKHCINLHHYCREHLPDQQYLSVRELVDIQKISDMQTRTAEFQSESPSLSDYSGFRSSFRIIAKQNSFKKTGPMFSLDADFDVFYTIDPDPDYIRELTRYRGIHGKDPLGYTRLVRAYEAMREQIYHLMPQLPCFKPLFNKLKIISFFCHYLKTLKQAKKVPVFNKEDNANLSCFYLFPPLPIQKLKTIEGEIDFGKIFSLLSPSQKQMLIDYVLGEEIQSNDKLPNQIYSFIQPLLRKSFNQIKDESYRSISSFFFKVEIKTESELEAGFNPYIAHDLYRDKLHHAIKQTRAQLSENILDASGSFQLKKVIDLYQQQAQEIQSKIKNIEEETRKTTECLKRTKASLSLVKNKLSRAVTRPLKMSEIYRDLRKINKIAKVIFDIFIRGPYRYIRSFLENRLYGLNELRFSDLSKQKKEIKTKVTSLQKQQVELQQSLNKILEKIACLKKEGNFSSLYQTICLDVFDSYLKRQKIPVPIRGASIETLEEEPSKERLQIKRINGGCGLRMKSQSLCFDPQGLSILKQSQLLMRAADDETFKRVTVGAKKHPQGYVFKLSFTGFYGSTAKNYRWMPLLLSSTTEEQSLANLNLLTLIHEENKSAFEAALIERKENGSLRDSNGASLIHYAAAAKSSFYLNALIRRQADLTLTDAFGLTPLHHAAKAGVVENIRLLATHAPNTLNQASNNGATPLYLAAQNNQLAAARVLLNLNADPAKVTHNGASPIYTALLHGFEEMFLLLMSTGKALDKRLEDGSTLMHLVAQSGNMKLASQLVKKVYVEDRRKDSYTPLHLAAEAGFAEMCSLLMNKNLLLKFIDNSISFFHTANLPLKSGILPIHIAAIKNHAEVVQVLLDHKSYLFISEGLKQSAIKARLENKDEADAEKISKYLAYESALLLAIDNGSSEAADVIIQYASQGKGRAVLSQSNKDGRTPLKVALYLRQTAIIEKLLNAGADPLPPLEHLIALCKAHVDSLLIQSWISEQGFAAAEIQEAYSATIKHGHKEMTFIFEFIFGCSEFLDSANGWLKEHYAAKFDHFEQIERAVSNRAQLLIETASANTVDRKTPAAIAAEYGSIRTLKILLNFFKDRAISLEHQYQQKHLLLAAIEGCSIESADLIIHQMEDVNQALDSEGKTAAHYASLYGDVEMLDLLRSRGANFLIKDQKSHSAISYAFEYQIEDSIQYFLKSEYEIPLPATLLCTVAAKGTTKQIEMLFNKGLLIDEIEDSKKRTPIFYAIEHDNEVNFKFLLAKGANLNIRDHLGYTPLLLAASLGKTSFVGSLLAVPNVAGQTDPLGHNALHLAACFGHESCTRYLLQRSFKSTSLSKENKTAIQLAQENGHLHLISLLKGNGQHLKQIKKSIYQAIKSGDQEAFFSLLNQFPIEALLSFKIDKKRLLIPISHLVYLINKESASENTTIIFNEMWQRFPQALLAKDSDGNTLFHLMASDGQTLDFNQVSPLICGKKRKTILHLLATKSDKQHLTQALKASSTVEIQDEEGLSPLHDAINCMNEDSFSLLLQAGANPNLMSNERVTPLMLAIKKQNLFMVHELLKAGANPNLKGNKIKESGLHLAAALKNVDLVKTLIHYQANVNARDAWGQTPLHVAIKAGEEVIARLLIAAGASLYAKSTLGLNAAHYAAASENPKLIDWLERHRFPLDKPITRTQKPLRKARICSEKGFTPFLIATAYNNITMMQKLIEKGCNLEAVSSEGRNAVHIASLQGNKHTLQFFEQTRLFHDGQQILDSINLAIIKDSLQNLERFYPKESRGDMIVGENGVTAIHVAAKEGALQCLNYLLAKEGDWQKRCSFGKTALELAIEHNQLAIVHCFLQHIPQNQLQKTKYGQTLLHYAIEQKQLQIAALLIKEGFSVDEKDDIGQSPLNIALKKEDYPLVQLLLAAGANPNEAIHQKCQNSSCLSMIKKYLKARIEAEQAQDSLLQMAIHLGELQHLPLLVHLSHIDHQNREGLTALQLAVLKKDSNLVQSLLSYGPNLEILDHRKQTALGIALTVTYDLDIAQQLLEAQASLDIFDQQGLPILYAISSLPDKRIAKSLFQLVVSYLRPSVLIEPSELMLTAIDKKDLKLFLKLVQQGHSLRTEATPLLHYAVSKNSLNIVRAMVGWFQVDVYEKNAFGKDPLSLATQAGFNKMAHYLKKKTQQA